MRINFKRVSFVIGIKGKNQLALFDIVKEYYDKYGNLCYAKIIFIIKGKAYKKLIESNK